MAKDQPIEAILKNVLASIKRKKGRYTEEEVAKMWADIVGKKAARHTRLAAFKAGRLVVNVDASTWLYELTLKKKDIVKKLGERLKGKKLKEVRLRIGEINIKDKKK